MSRGLGDVYKRQEKLLEEKNITFAVNEDLIGEIWRERPALSCEPVMELDVKWAGESRKDKIAGIREQMKAKKANIFILTSLDDIAWLLNIRGNDIHCCPVVLSYLIMTDTEVRLYANAAAFSEEICTNLADDGVKIYPYEDVYSYVQTISEDKKILLSKDSGCIPSYKRTKLTDALHSAFCLLYTSDAADE